MDVLTFERGFFLFRFASETGMSTIIEKGPWLFVGRYMILRKWSRGLSLSNAILHRIPVWAKFHNVPIELWSEEGLSHIASAVGRPLYADAATEACTRVTFARICVEVDASMPLVDDFDVEILKEDGSSSLVSINVSNQWRPPVYEECKVFGHATSACKPHAQSTSSVGPIQNLEATNQSEQVPQAGEQWHLVERRKRSSPSRKTNSIFSPITSSSSASLGATAQSSSQGPPAPSKSSVLGEESLTLPIASEGGSSSAEPSSERLISSAQIGLSGSVPPKESSFITEISGSEGLAPIVLENGVASSPLKDIQLMQISGLDSDFAIPLLSSKLATRL